MTDLRLTPLIGHKKYDMLINFNNDIYRLICSKFLWSNIFSISRKLGDPTDPETGYGFTITVDEKKIIKNVKPLTELHCNKDHNYDLSLLRSHTNKKACKRIIKNSYLPKNYIDEIVEKIRLDEEIEKQEALNNNMSKFKWLHDLYL